MNNFVFSQDPILYSSTVPQYHMEPQEIKKQLDTMMAQYQTLQQNVQDNKTKEPYQTPVDYLGDLDTLISELDESDLETLNNNEEFAQLNAYIQQSIQQEIINSVKWKINSNPEKIDKINKLKSIVKDIKKEKDMVQKRNMYELNDYIQNYSDMTFNEYKKIKQLQNEGK